MPFPIASLETLIVWYETGKKPTGDQFARMLSSFRHQSTPVPLSEIAGLVQALQNKAPLLHSHAADTITGLTAAINAYIETIKGITLVPLVAGQIPAEYLPSFVDDVLEFDTKDDIGDPDVSFFPNPGERGKIYIATDTNFSYRWSGSDYVQVGGGNLVTETDPTVPGYVKSLTSAEVAEFKAEKGERQTADAALALQIAAEKLERQAADAELVTQITNEATARTNADAALADDLNIEATTRTNADAALANDLATEAATRASADSALQLAINNEALARANKDNVLTDAINNEVTARAAAISALIDSAPADGNTLKKLYNLIAGGFKEKAVGTIAERDLLDITSVPTNVFVLDDGDSKWAIYKALTTGVGASYVKIQDEDSLSNAINKAAIKAAYESNPDTNAFTNALLNKLNGIAAGATANASDAFLLDRTKHTGQQTAATISDFENTVRGIKASDTQVGGVQLATDTEVQVETAPTPGTKVVDRLRLFNWWTWVKAANATYNTITIASGAATINAAGFTDQYKAVISAAADFTLNISNPTTQMLVIIDKTVATNIVITLSISAHTLYAAENMWSNRTSKQITLQTEANARVLLRFDKQGTNLLLTAIENYTA